MESRALQMPKKRKFRFSWRAIVAVVLLFITLFPIYWLLAMSIRDNSEMAGSIPVIPQSFTLEHFKALFTEQDFGLALTKQAINHVEDLQGKRTAMDAVFAWHHFAHSHNELLSGDKLGGFDAKAMADANKAAAGERR